MVKQYNGYTFKCEISNNEHRPYKATCMENEMANESALSYDDAIGLIIGMMDFIEGTLIKNSCSIEHVEKLFKGKLMGKKLSKLNEIVEEEIADKVKGKVYSIEREEFATEQIYETENFVIIAKCETGRPRGVTSVIVSRRNKD